MQVIYNTRNRWWSILITGILVTIAGLALLVWPFIAASWLLAIFLGIALISGGSAALTHTRATALSRFLGLLVIVAGILAIVFNELAASLLVTIVGSVFITVGLFWVVVSLSVGGGVVSTLPGVLAIIAGLIPMFWPQFALSFIAVFAGLMLLVWGVTLIGAAVRTRR